MFDTVLRVYELMGIYGLSLMELCQRCDIHHSTITTTKKRGGQLSLDTVKRICDGLGITMAEFFMNSDEEKRYNIDWNKKAAG